MAVGFTKYNSESEFGDKFCEVLEHLGFETWKEVSLGFGHPTIDLIGKIRNTYVAFELKTQINDTVLEQAVHAKPFVDYAYAVVPIKNKDYTLSEVKALYAKEKGIGVLLIDPAHFLKFKESNLSKSKSGSTIIYQAMLAHSLLLLSTARRRHRFTSFKKSFNFNIERFLHEDQKECHAGSVAGGAITDYQRSITVLVEYMDKNSDATLRDAWIKLKLKLHWKHYYAMWKSLSSLENSYEAQYILRNEIPAKD